MKKYKIWLSLAQMGGGEMKYIEKAFDENWVVPMGPNVDAFEKELSGYVGENKQVVALSSGTAAIHLGLKMLGVGTGDEVVCQSFTFIASVSPVVYLGASPVFVDSEGDTWNMSPRLLEEAITDRKSKTGKYPKAIVVVHLYGMPAKIEEIITVAAKYDIPVLEDSAEAVGSTYKGRKCGTFGEIGVLSFNGNKVITTSGGGALICNGPEVAKRVVFYATQARENKPFYWHEETGYNYRLSNICAGIGLGQMEVLDHHLECRKKNHTVYSRLLGNIEGVEVMQNPSVDFESNFWLTCITVSPLQTGVTADQIREYLETQGIESRLLWCPMHLQPVFSDMPFYGDGTSERLFDTGLCLPSGSSLSINDIEFVSKSVVTFISHSK